jgi:hypothetical protein
MSSAQARTAPVRSPRARTSSARAAARPCPGTSSQRTRAAGPPAARASPVRRAGRPPRRRACPASAAAPCWSPRGRPCPLRWRRARGGAGGPGWCCWRSPPWGRRPPRCWAPRSGRMAACPRRPPRRFRPPPARRPRRSGWPRGRSRPARPAALTRAEPAEVRSQFVVWLLIVIEAAVRKQAAGPCPGRYGMRVRTPESPEPGMGRAQRCGSGCPAIVA